MSKKLILNRALLVVLISLSAFGPAIADEKSASETVEFAEAVFAKYHFDDQLPGNAIAYTKGRMASMRDAVCVPNGEQKKAARNVLLQTAIYEPQIRNALVATSLPAQVRKWVFTTTLMRIDVASRGELLAAPSNPTIDTAIFKWLWSDYHAIAGSEAIDTTARLAWLQVCQVHYPKRK